MKRGDLLAGGAAFCALVLSLVFVPVRAVEEGRHSFSDSDIEGIRSAIATEASSMPAGKQRRRFERRWEYWLELMRQGYLPFDEPFPPNYVWVWEAEPMRLHRDEGVLQVYTGHRIRWWLIGLEHIALLVVLGAWIAAVRRRRQFERASPSGKTA